ncbi:hypothetical protein F5Y14DRAFT_448570 [Nemania sp. NC0429]|nr:hypothetical protein F5Y14DRAFT_448570 [Nemania sp. NC0429]
MASEAGDGTLAPGQPSTERTSQPKSLGDGWLELVEKCHDRCPDVEIILVGDIWKPTFTDIWGKGAGYFWPAIISKADIFKFTYGAGDGDTKPNRADHIKDLWSDISNGKLQERSIKLRDVVIVETDNAKAQEEQTQEASTREAQMGKKLARKEPPQEVRVLALFGTPHLVHGLRQWAHIVIEKTTRGSANKERGSKTPSAER